MKLFIFVFISTLILGSCDRQDVRINRKYVLENGTNRTLNAEFYRGGSMNYSKKITGPGILKEGLSSNSNG